MTTPRPDGAQYVLRIDGSLADRTAILAEDLRQHGDAVRRVASVTCGPDRAADVVQEVFLRFWLHPERFDPTRGTLRTYLLTIGRNAAIDVARADGARRAREDRIGRERAVVAAIDDGVVRDEAAAQVRAALEQLPAGQRDAIATAFFGGCSYQAAAVVLGESEGTVKSRIRSGLRRLRVTLDETIQLTTAAPTT